MGKVHLRFAYCGATGGDCRAPYDVFFTPICTLRDLISAILQRGDWGYIDIESPCCLRCEYKGRNVISGSFPEDILAKVVKRVKASGGWLNMDYLVWL